MTREELVEQIEFVLGILDDSGKFGMAAQALYVGTEDVAAWRSLLSDARAWEAVLATLVDWDAPALREKAEILIRNNRQMTDGIAPRTLRIIADVLEAEEPPDLRGGLVGLPQDWRVDQDVISGDWLVFDDNGDLVGRALSEGEAIAEALRSENAPDLRDDGDYTDAAGCMKGAFDPRPEDVIRRIRDGDTNQG